jgi:UDP-N-acetylglucosamine 2-epimerase (non-hydrolysing)
MRSRKAKRPFITLVVAARPNFMKVAPLYRALRAQGAALRLVNTGQHYDPLLSAVFFKQLGIPAPDVNLRIGPGSPAEQLSRVIHRFERDCLRRRPDAVVVVGDVTSTLGAALAAANLDIPVAHVEAGLRSRDWRMPEERNRVLTDRVSRWLFLPSPDAAANLAREGIPRERQHLVGNIMIDSLRHHAPQIAASRILTRLGLRKKNYVLVTLHRPSNVDDPRALKRWMALFAGLARTLPVVFPVHPRTRKRLSAAQRRAPGLILSDPQPYFDFQALLRHAALVMSDSGGVQEETSYLGVPCLTLRENTERPITISHGTNRLAGVHPQKAGRLARAILRSRRGFASRRPPLWDGATAPRIAKILCNQLRSNQGGGRSHV